MYFQNIFFQILNKIIIFLFDYELILTSKPKFLYIKEYWGINYEYKMVKYLSLIMYLK